MYLSLLYLILHLLRVLTEDFQVMEDEKPSAQWEHTLLMTEHGVEVLTY